MLQEWADMIDAWVAGKKHLPVLPSFGSHGVVLDPAGDCPGQTEMSASARDGDGCLMLLRVDLGHRL
jgi:hypothetical protein